MNYILVVLNEFQNSFKLYLLQEGLKQNILVVFLKNRIEL